MVEATIDVSDTDEITVITDGRLCVERHNTDSQTGQINHSVEVGESYIDDYEPTPSTEVNTVVIERLVDARANEFSPPGCDKYVSEFNTNKFYPDDDPIVAARYPNMSDDGRLWFFPQSRLR